MRKTIYVLSLLILVLGTWLVVLWLPSFTSQEDDRQETRYGLNEGLELVEQDYGKDGKRYVVEDADGKELFVIPYATVCSTLAFATDCYDFGNKSRIERVSLTDKVW